MRPVHDRWPKHRDRDVGELAAEFLDDVFDLELVRRIREIEIGAQRRILGKRYVVVGMRAVDGRRGSVEDPLDSGPCRASKYVLAAVDVDIAHRALVFERLHDERKMDYDIYPLEAGLDRRMAYIDVVPDELRVGEVRLDDVETKYAFHRIFSTQKFDQTSRYVSRCTGYCHNALRFFGLCHEV